MSYYVRELDKSFNIHKEAEDYIVESDILYELIYWNKRVEYKDEVKTVYYHYVGIPNDSAASIKNYTIIKQGER